MRGRRLWSRIGPGIAQCLFESLLLNSHTRSCGFCHPLGDGKPSVFHTSLGYRAEEQV